MNELVVIDRDMIQDVDLKELGLDALDVRHLSEEAPLRLGEAERVYYFLSLIGGGLRYQTELITGNPDVAQWVIVAGTGNQWALDGFSSTFAGTKASVHMLSAAGKSGEELKEEFEAIAAIRVRACLVYAKRPGVGKRTAVDLLSALRPEWEFELCEGEEEILRERCAGMNQVLIVGSTPQDFSLSRPERLETEPILFYNRCDEDVQRFLQRQALWDELRMFLQAREWIFPQRYPDFYMGSALYENWAAGNAGSAKSLSLRDDFVMWDRYGLPMERDAYTEEKVTKFLGQFCALQTISSRL